MNKLLDDLNLLQEATLLLAEVPRQIWQTNKFKSNEKLTESEREHASAKAAQSTFVILIKENV